MKGLARLLSAINHSPPARSWVKVWGNTMASPSLDRTLYLWLHRLGWMGAAERRKLAEWIRPGMRVVDVGANIGLYGGLFSRLVGPEGQVVCVEPVDANQESLCRSAARNEWHNVEIHHCALAAESGYARLVCDPLNSGNNCIEPLAVASLGASPLRTLDDIVAGRRVDFLKIDVQGWEAAVLQGGKNTLRKNRPMRVFLEIWPRGLRKAGSNEKEIFDLLKSAGFRIEYPAGWNGTSDISASGYYDITAVAD